MRCLPAVALAAAVLLFSSGASAAEPALSAAGLPHLSEDRGATLKLRGTGVFRYLGVKLYAAFFYVAPDVIAPGETLGEKPMRLMLRYLHDIPKDAIVKAAETNLRNNPEVNYEAIRERVERLHARYSDLKKGDECALVYADGKTVAFFKERPIVEIEGQDFARAYFGIWLSKYSINQKLRKSLLGERGAR